MAADQRQSVERIGRAQRSQTLLHDAFARLPRLSCASWLVADLGTGHVLADRASAERRQIASVTKIMTAWIVARTLEAYPQLKHCRVPVSRLAAGMPGTSAQLRVNETYTPLELLHGLMLPSGNDAAVALAEFFGPLFDALERGLSVSTQLGGVQVHAAERTTPQATACHPGPPRLRFSVQNEGQVCALPLSRLSSLSVASFSTPASPTTTPRPHQSVRAAHTPPSPSAPTTGRTHRHQDAGPTNSTPLSSSTPRSTTSVHSVNGAVSNSTTAPAAPTAQRTHSRHARTHHTVLTHAGDSTRAPRGSRNMLRPTTRAPTAHTRATSHTPVGESGAHTRNHSVGSASSAVNVHPNMPRRGTSDLGTAGVLDELGSATGADDGDDVLKSLAANRRARPSDDVGGEGTRFVRDAGDPAFAHDDDVDYTPCGNADGDRTGGGDLTSDLSERSHHHRHDGLDAGEGDAATNDDDDEEEDDGDDDGDDDNSNNDDDDDDDDDGDDDDEDGGQHEGRGAAHYDGLCSPMLQGDGFNTTHDGVAMHYLDAIRCRESPARPEDAAGPSSRTRTRAATRHLSPAGRIKHSPSLPLSPARMVHALRSLDTDTATIATCDAMAGLPLQSRVAMSPTDVTTAVPVPVSTAATAIMAIMNDSPDTARVGARAGTLSSSHTRAASGAGSVWDVPAHSLSSRPPTLTQVAGSTGIGDVFVAAAAAAVTSTTTPHNNDSTTTTTTTTATPVTSGMRVRHVAPPCGSGTVQETLISTSTSARRLSTHSVTSSASARSGKGAQLMGAGSAFGHADTRRHIAALGRGEGGGPARDQLVDEVSSSITGTDSDAAAEAGTPPLLHLHRRSLQLSRTPRGSHAHAHSSSSLAHAREDRVRPADVDTDRDLSAGDAVSRRNSFLSTSSSTTSLAFAPPIAATTLPHTPRSLIDHHGPQHGSPRARQSTAASTAMGLQGRCWVGGSAGATMVSGGTSAAHEVGMGFAAEVRVGTRAAAVQGKGEQWWCGVKGSGSHAESVGTITGVCASSPSSSAAASSSSLALPRTPADARDAVASTLAQAAAPSTSYPPTVTHTSQRPSPGMRTPLLPAVAPSAGASPTPLISSSQHPLGLQQTAPPQRAQRSTHQPLASTSPASPGVMQESTTVLPAPPSSFSPLRQGHASCSSSLSPLLASTRSQAHTPSSSPPTTTTTHVDAHTPLLLPAKTTSTTTPMYITTHKHITASLSTSTTIAPSVATTPSHTTSPTQQHSALALALARARIANRPPPAAADDATGGVPSSNSSSSSSNNNNNNDNNNNSANSNNTTSNTNTSNNHHVSTSSNTASTNTLLSPSSSTSSSHRSTHGVWIHPRPSTAAATSVVVRVSAGSGSGGGGGEADRVGGGGVSMRPVDLGGWGVDAARSESVAAAAGPTTTTGQREALPSSLTHGGDVALARDSLACVSERRLPPSAAHVLGVLSASEPPGSSLDCVSMFVRHMNATAQQLGMVDTVFANPHGLMEGTQHSTATDVALLAHAARGDSLVVRVCSTKKFQCVVPWRLALPREGYPRVVRWRNSNDLLWRAGSGHVYSGLKTGVTPAAGGCLVTTVRRTKRLTSTGLLVVVLGAAGVIERFVDTDRIVQWCMAVLPEERAPRRGRSRTSKRKTSAPRPHTRALGPATKRGTSGRERVGVRNAQDEGKSGGPVRQERDPEHDAVQPSPSTEDDVTVME